MSLKPDNIGIVPEETARIARAAFPQGNIYLRMRDKVGPLFSDAQFADLFSQRGQPAEAPWRLALITIMQYVEGLSDRQAVTAVRGRIDWKYMLGLELIDSGFDSTVLSEFRTRIVIGSAEQLLLDTILVWCREHKLLKLERQRTDSTRVLAAVRGMTRLESSIETMRHALNSLATIAPTWLAGHCRVEWVERYANRAEEYHLPKSDQKRSEYALIIGIDGYELLDQVYAKNTPTWLKELPAVQTLRRMWIQQYYQTSETIKWRTAEEGIAPSAILINSPYDIDAHYTKQGVSSWVGYKVHITETCVEDSPNLITNVETTSATTSDGIVTPIVHDHLQKKNMLPKLHLADNGFVDSDLLVTSQEQFGVRLLGPTRADYHWQAKAGKGFDAGNFEVDWSNEQAICPAGKVSSSWTPAIDDKVNCVIKIKFSRKDCGPCPLRTDCTKAKSLRRTLTIRPQQQYLQLQENRAQQETASFANEYAIRAGIEGTISQGVSGFALRKARYVGLAKTRLQHILTAAAINFVRIDDWLAEQPRAKTRRSAFVRLMKRLTPAA